jgi:hypothetical protein
MRRLADYLGIWEVCDRPACRTARACRSRNAACFEPQREEIVDRLELVLDWAAGGDNPPDDATLDDYIDYLRDLGAPL